MIGSAVRIVSSSLSTSIRVEQVASLAHTVDDYHSRSIKWLSYTSLSSQHSLITLINSLNEDFCDLQINFDASVTGLY